MPNFIDTSVKGCGRLAAAGDFFLAPHRVLAKGRTYTIVNDQWVARQEESRGFLGVLKKIGAVFAWIPSTLIGVALKKIGYRSLRIQAKYYDAVDRSEDQEFAGIEQIWRDRVLIAGKKEVVQLDRAIDDNFNQVLLREGVQYLLDQEIVQAEEVEDLSNIQKKKAWMVGFLVWLKGVNIEHENFKGLFSRGNINLDLTEEFREKEYFLGYQLNEGDRELLFHEHHYQQFKNFFSENLYDTAITIFNKMPDNVFTSEEGLSPEMAILVSMANEKVGSRECEGLLQNVKVCTARRFFAKSYIDARYQRILGRSYRVPGTPEADEDQLPIIGEDCSAVEKVAYNLLKFPALFKNRQIWVTIGSR